MEKHCTGIHALREGLIWRIGSGEKVNILLDPWVPNKVTRRPTPRGQIVVTRVAELIDPVTGSWDDILIRDIFWPEDVQAILSIPIRPETEDFLAWHYDSKGQFSVKSAYDVLEDKKEREAKRQRGESSAPGQRTIVDWSKLWSLPYAPKIKHFLHRLAHNSLRLRMSIARRGVEADSRCPVCMRLDEDGGHCFLKCKMVKKCWQAAGLENVRLYLTQMQTSHEVVKASKEQSYMDSSRAGCPES